MKAIRRWYEKKQWYPLLLIIVIGAPLAVYLHHGPAPWMMVGLPLYLLWSTGWTWLVLEVANKRAAALRTTVVETVIWVCLALTPTVSRAWMAFWLQAVLGGLLLIYFFWAGATVHLDIAEVVGKTLRQTKGEGRLATADRLMWLVVVLLIAAAGALVAVSRH